MAEIKNNFFQGKMNKDLDERLVPNGQYRDALNIEVSTSDADDVGTVQSVKGNTLVSADAAPTGSSIVGEITDEKNNCIYYFVSGPETLVDDFDSSDTQPTVCKDLILKYDNSGVTNVFTDIYRYLASGDNATININNKTITFPDTSAYKDNLATNMYVSIFDTGKNYVWNNRITDVTDSTITLENEIDSLDGITINSSIIIHISHKNEKRALNFDTNYYITGINVIEDFLMWTDNNSEPKKISISRSSEGTVDANQPTKLYIDGSLDYPLTTDKKADETHATVIRKSPINAVSVEVKNTRSNITGKITDTLDMSGVNQNDIIEVGVSSNPFLPNDILNLDTGTPSAINFQVQIKVLSLIGETGFLAKVLSTSVTSSSAFNIFLFDVEKPLFKDKFSFFATRWKYVDGEYSTFSPFSEAAFLPSSFEYDTKEAFNKGMENNLKEVQLTNIIPNNIPEDVVQVDILYTESNSPEVYKVDSIRNDSTNDTFWSDNSYVITKENIYSLLEEKQLLRQWDNVPKKALGQEIVGNRLVYANYEQNYDLENQNVNIEAFVDERIFTGPELIPNPYVSETLEGWTIPNAQSGSWNHNRIKTNNNREVGSLELTSSAGQYHKFFTTTNILEAEQGAQYYFSFTVSDSSGDFQIQGPQLMSGDAATGYYNSGIRVSSDGDYSGTISLNSLRSTATGSFRSTSHADFRHIMFQKTSASGTTGTCKISNFSLKKVITNKKQSVKSLRNYKLGVVYTDEYGRETPVLTGKNASVDVNKDRSNNINCIKSKITSDAPNWATHFKYFVKETSSDYNNLALDRIYRSGDNAFWLSFPSSERNKVDEEDFLILKKGHGDTGVSVENNEARYKVLDISANAPDFIKQNKSSVGVGGPTSNINTLFDIAGNRPTINKNRISFDKAQWINTDQNPDLELVFSSKNLAYEFKDNNNRVSQLYKIEALSAVDVGTGSDHYEIISNLNFNSEDISWIMDGSSLSSGVSIEVFAIDIENKAQFDGRFFVKINEDEHIITNVYNNTTNVILDQIQANADSFFKMDSANTLGLLNAYNATSGGNLVTQNLYSTADDATNVMSIIDADSVGNWDDLTSTAFKDSPNGGNPFPNLPVNDTLYYEARPWFDSGDSQGGGTQQAGNGKNIYKAIPEQLALATTHVDFTAGNTHLNKAQVGTSGILDNIVGVDQSSIISSSGTTVGRLKHAAFSYSYGLFQQKTGSVFSIYGSVGAYMKFLRIFKFGIGTDNDLGITGEFSGKWFIDNMSYIGFQPDGSYDPANGKYFNYHRAVHYDVNNSNVLEMASMDGFNFGNANQINTANNDYLRMGRGIYTATTDDFNADTVFYGSGNEFHEIGSDYMQLSFGAIKRVDDIDEANYDDPSQWSSKGWVSDESAFVDVKDKIKIGAKFRFTDDASNEVFTILDFKKVQRYNHTPFPGDTFAYYQWYDDINGIEDVTFSQLRDPSIPIEFRARSTHDSANNFDKKNTNTSVSIEQDSITDEEKRFVRGTNRRLTYILKLDKKPGSGSFHNPLNTLGTSDAAGLMDGNTSRVIEFVGDVINESVDLTTTNPAIFETEPKTTEGLDVYYEASEFFDIKDHGVTNRLNYFNCYSFSNGVESNRIKDVFNKPSLGKGIVASTTLEEVYKQDNRGSGLIFSGIYNSTSNVNNLNQFIQAEKITKDVNPTYGTIQKLYTKDSNLLVLCEDKVLKILANKDAVFNADGNTQLTANKNVLGQTIPYVGEFGISKNPRSFAAQSHRAYFTDKQRGAVLRLSMDGLTTISQYGMNDFFRDNLPTSTTLIGSYDTRKNEYNLKLDGATDYVVSFNENIKGWSSFKSFTDMQAGVSLNNNYYTFKDGELWKHHSNEARCTFYSDTFKSGNSLEPYVEVVLNSDPYFNKRFKTLNYEGTQSKVDLLDVTSDGSDADFYNIEAKTGWYVDDITTPTQSGSVNEFLEKDNKWYNYIKGDAITASNIDTSDFNVQGLGTIADTSESS